MATTTQKTYLKEKVGNKYETLVDIKAYPDLGGAAEQIETTTLSSDTKTYIPGIKDTPVMEFTANYDKDTYSTLKNDETVERSLAIYFGDNGDNGNNGIFTFSGRVSVSVVGGGIGAVREMKVTIFPTSEVKMEA